MTSTNDKDSEIVELTDLIEKGADSSIAVTDGGCAASPAPEDGAVMAAPEGDAALREGQADAGRPAAARAGSGMQAGDSLMEAVEDRINNILTPLWGRVRALEVRGEETHRPTPADGCAVGGRDFGSGPAAPDVEARLEAVKRELELALAEQAASAAGSAAADAVRSRDEALSGMIGSSVREMSASFARDLEQLRIEQSALNARLQSLQSDFEAACARMDAAVSSAAGEGQSGTAGQTLEQERIARLERAVDAASARLASLPAGPDLEGLVSSAVQRALHAALAQQADGRRQLTDLAEQLGSLEQAMRDRESRDEEQSERLAGIAERLRGCEERLAALQAGSGTLDETELEQMAARACARVLREEIAALTGGDS
ncbi:MAG: hypothetical protein Q4F72_07435 [Desulfovibrionaceae bacterium]|nr:hypothetical protein [Desulfovibrionaceae bacterium]